MLRCAVLVVGLSGCGDSMSMVGDACPRVIGKFSAHMVLREALGKCGGASSIRNDPMEFTEKGLVSPVGDIAHCGTAQVDCTVDVTCTSQVISMRLDFAGTLSTDGRTLDGTAVLSGSYDGCTKLVYDVGATALE